MNQKPRVTLGSVRVWRQQLIHRLLRVMIIFGLLMVAAGSYSAYLRGAVWAVGAYIAAYLGLVFLTLWRRAPYVLQVGILQVLLYVITLVTFLTRGVGDSSRIYLLMMVFVSAFFWGWRASLFTLGLLLLTMGGMSFGFAAGYITNYQEVVSTDLSSWIALTVDLLSMSVFMAVLIRYFIFRFDTYVAQSRRLARELEQNQTALEARVAERTSALEKRGAQLATASQVAREAAGIRDMKQLLERTVNLISERFDFYHTGIFLIDEAGEYAVLRAASSEGGQRMLAREHRLRVGEQGVVGYVTGRGEHRIALDVGEDAAYFDNPDLPRTRSEVALPLQVRGEIIGALDVQSVASEAFTSEDVTVLQTLADQVAVAVDNARLFAESQEALEAARRAYGELSQKGWQELFRTRTEVGARYDPHAILPPDGRQRESVKAALREKKPVADAEGKLHTLAIPVEVRGHVIGVVDAYKPDEDGAWTQEEIELLETLTAQLSQALESARLYEDTQRQAAFERVTGEIASRFRESLDVDRILQTAASEFQEVLNLDTVEVRVGPAPLSDEM
ncbi:MAG: GAF domain-containing protein [Anaerolineales bacterium]